MTTLKERLKESLANQAPEELFTSNQEEHVLTFIKQELMLLAEEVEKDKVSNYYDVKAQINFNSGLNIAASIIRTRADEI